MWPKFRRRCGCQSRSRRHRRRRNCAGL